VETVCQNMRDLLKKIDTSPTLNEAGKESEKLMVKKLNFFFSYIFFHLKSYSITCITDFCNNYLCVGDSVRQLR
jgi:hypothetical protein